MSEARPSASRPGPVRRWLRRRWKALFSWLLGNLWFIVSLAAIAVALGVAARYVAGLVKQDTIFSISARSEVLDLTLLCGQRTVIWDLPPGRLLADGSDAQPTLAKGVSIQLDAGAHARVSIGPDKRWRVSLQQGSKGQACDVPGRTGLAMQADGRPYAPGRQQYEYESLLPAHQGARPLLELRGRVTIGQSIPFGSGFVGAVQVPILSQARIEARTPDPLTGQRRLLHEEQVDAGGIVDSHGCLQASGADLARCLANARSEADGFIHISELDDKPGFDVQLVVVGSRVGVQQQAGAERHILVSSWAHIVTRSDVQMFAASLALTSVLFGLLVALKDATPSSRKKRKRRRRRSSASRPAPAPIKEIRE